MLHSAANSGQTAWDPIDVFAADAQPDKLTALLVTPYRELLLAGPKSIEQFERLSVGSATPVGGAGRSARACWFSYIADAFADNGIWCINDNREFVRASGQVSRPISDDIGKLAAEDRRLFRRTGNADADSRQKFIILQIPNATNAYGTPGVTLLSTTGRTAGRRFYGGALPTSRRRAGRAGRTSSFGPAPSAATAAWSLDDTEYQNAGVQQRVYIRTGHYDQPGEVRVDNLRVRMKRGLAGQTTAGQCSSSGCAAMARTRRGGRPRISAASARREFFMDLGGFGCAKSFQIEVEMTDAAEFELVSMQAQLTAIGR